MKKQLKLLLVGVAASQLMSCASLELMAVGGVSYLVTGKGISDHALSMTMDQDCAFHRVLIDEPLCSEEILTNEPSDVLLAQKTQLTESLSPDDRSLSPADKDTLQMEQAALVVQQDVNAEDQPTILPSGVDTIDNIVDVDLPWDSEPDIQKNAPQIYAVVGSFNDLKYAFERSNLYRIYNTQIVQAPKDSGIRYRVVIGPLQDRGLIEHIPQKSTIDKNPHWAVELCEDSLLPPPCGGQLLAKK